MTTTRRGVLGGGVGALCLAASGVAFAHAYLQGSEPPASAVLAQPPGEIRLRFSEALEPGFIDLKVLHDGHALEAAAAPQVGKDGKSVRVALRKAPEARGGDYEVQWRIVAKDGHPTQGRFTFRVGAR